MVSDAVLIIIAYLLMAGGMLGIVLPFVPGTPLAFGGLLLFAFATHFTAVGWKLLVVFGLLTLGTFVFDIIAPIAGARKYKASRAGMFGSAVGLVVGGLIFPPFGFFFGPVTGALAGELIAGRKPREAIYAAEGTIIGFLIGAALKLFIILAMLGVLVWATVSLFV